MTYFREDNTDGYDAADLAALNQAMQYIVESNQLDGKSEIDAAMAEVLFAWDRGLRGDALVRAYERRHRVPDPQGRVHARYRFGR